MFVRLRFNVHVGIYERGELYDVEATEGMRKLVEGGLADIVPYPPRVSVSEDERDTTHE